LAAFVDRLLPGARGAVLDASASTPWRPTGSSSSTSFQAMLAPPSLSVRPTGSSSPRWSAVLW